MFYIHFVYGLTYRKKQSVISLLKSFVAALHHIENKNHGFEINMSKLPSKSSVLKTKLSKLQIKILFGNFNLKTVTSLLKNHFITNFSDISF